MSWCRLMRLSRLSVVFALAVLLALSSVEDVFASTILLYDDDDEDEAVCAPEDGVTWFAVRFALPDGWSSGSLSAFQVFKSGMEGSSEMGLLNTVVYGPGVSPTSGPNLLGLGLYSLEPPGGSWKEKIFYATPPVVVPREFYILFGLGYRLPFDPSPVYPGSCIGLDTDGSDGRTYSSPDGPVFNWILVGGDLMARALVDPVSTSAPVGGVVLPVDAFVILAPWLAVIGLLGCIGTVAIVVRKRRP